MIKKAKSTKKAVPNKKVKSTKEPIVFKPLSRRIIRRYIDYVEHFFVPGRGGWAIWLEKNDEGILDYFPQLKYDNKGKIYRDKSVKAPPELFQILLEFKLSEIVSEFFNSLNSYSSGGI